LLPGLLPGLLTRLLSRLLSRLLRALLLAPLLLALPTRLPTALCLLLAAGLRLLPAAFAPPAPLFETAAQRFEVVREAARAVERLFRAVALGASGRGLRLLQAFRHLA
jgi:hypothetical protein